MLVEQAEEEYLIQKVSSTGRKEMRKEASATKRRLTSQVTVNSKGADADETQLGSPPAVQMRREPRS